MNKKIVIVVRFAFGLLLLALGGMAFMNLPIPDFYSPKAFAFLQAMGDTGYMNFFMGLVQIMAGLMFIAKRYVALGAAIIAPITVNIVVFHLFLDLKTIAPGLVIFGLNMFIAYTEREKYKNLLRSK